ncbi:hypothetical protein [Desulfovibrio sp. JC022]|uniref:hypothetical protein n=1 Tax=Desulfovibrio sp. JC022 TaxID=2593642 RepID=UPI0013D03EAB|nr:hypothetical protein [Desulfovibrio sp. JC022]NDV24368.1 hypothetical protein [Desulfovibrio sp. JC022]
MKKMILTLALVLLPTLCFAGPMEDFVEECTKATQNETACMKIYADAMSSHIFDGANFSAGQRVKCGAGLELRVAAHACEFLPIGGGACVEAAKRQCARMCGGCPSIADRFCQSDLPLTDMIKQIKNGKFACKQ